MRIPTWSRVCGYLRRVISPRQAVRRRSAWRVASERLEPRQLLAAAPVINEVMAVNATGLLDLDLDTSDWIEIHNPDPTPLDLTAWHLTDDVDWLDQWTFPAGATVSGNGYLVVFASDKDLTSDLNELHTNFRINGGGEFLALVTPQLEIAHQYNPLPPQRADVSYGLADAGPLYFAEPTPGTANGEGFVGFVADTTFDYDRGFYDSSETFVLTIATKTVGATIYYTTDFTEPAPDNPSAKVFDPQVPIPIITTTVVRAVAVKEGFEPSNVDTQTYIFLSDTIHQPTDPVGFPSSWGNRSTDYEMDPAIVNDPVWGPQLEAAMRAHPTISLVMDNDSWFDRTDGIIANSGQHGDQWERPMSIEFFDYPDGEQIQVNAGIRINGNASRNANRGGKHNFRVVFREEYGPRRLKFPLFDEIPQITSFDNFILRGGNGDSFVNPGVFRRAQYIRDQWHRDMQTAMGNPTAAQDYVQLYINGLYWGLYHTIERIDDEFLADHFGGEEEDYDMIKDSVAEEGDKVAWNAMLAIANGGVATPDAYAAIQEYLDVDSLIDYILINFYSGNDDWGRKNWRAKRLREPGASFTFFVWDSERTDLNALSGGSVTKNVTGTNVTDTPSRIHQRLTANLEYLSFAAGACTPTSRPRSLR
ncbi:MAG: CotH kinase family protein [Planctomycetes bacterium]|nr:CotH kinase family protein [Planctomycetota bacterium]